MLGEEVIIKGNNRTIKGKLYGYEQEWGINPILTLHLSNVEYEFEARIKREEVTNNINCRCTTKTKEEKTMSVKIKKQPKETSLEELKKGEEYERIIIHIDKEKKEELENRYGLKYNFYEKIDINDSELDFKEHYIRITETNKVTLPYNIPYDLIEKIEIVEK